MSSFRLSTSPAFKLAILVIVGILFGQSVNIPLWILAFILGLCIVGGISCLFVPSRHSIIGTVAIVLVCLLAGATKIRLDRDRSSFVPDSLLSRTVTIVGRMVEPPVIAGNVIRFVIRMNEVRLQPTGLKVDENVRVSMIRLRGEQDTPRLDYGMVVALHGMLSRPSDARNPGDFSEKQYYEANGITMFMLVKGRGKSLVLDSSRGSWLMESVVFPARKYILRVLDSSTDGEAAAFLKGLTIGERSGISVSTRQLFTNSGVAHVLAVSGSNVVVVSAVFFFLFGVLRFPKWAVVILSVIMIALYMLVTGSQPPVVRATITASIFLIGSLSQVKSNPFNSLGVAALLILAWDARQLFDVGFQLSFVAVLSIVYLYPIMNGWISILSPEGLIRRTVIWTLRVCAVSLAASLGTFPLTAIYFGKVSVIGLIANIAVIPAVGASVVLGFVTVVMSLVSNWVASSYAAVNQLLLDCTLWLVRLVGSSPLAFVDTTRFLPIYSIPFYVALLLVFNLQVRPVARRLVVLLLICLNIVVLVPPSATLANTERLRISFLDVGQGDAAVIEVPSGKTIMIDAGPKTGTYDAGERVVAPFLRRRGISRIDLLVVSHPHDDHFGGMPHILEHFDVRQVLESGQPVRSRTYREYVADVRMEQCPVDTARSGMPIMRLDDLRLYVLFPTSLFVDADTTHRHPNLNNTSVVFRMQYGDVSFLFTGDAEMEAEEEMANRYGDFLRSSLLKAGHHGSKTSSTQEFLECVRPASAVISVGRYNKFGHPSEDVIARLDAMNSEVHRTDNEGAIIFETDGRTLTRVDWR